MNKIGKFVTHLGYLNLLCLLHVLLGAATEGLSWYALFSAILHTGFWVYFWDEPEKEKSFSWELVYLFVWIVISLDLAVKIVKLVTKG